MIRSALVFLLSLSLTSFASAHGHDHDDDHDHEQEHGHEDFPEGALLILEGQDAVSGAECALFVMDIGENESGPFALVETSYSHQGDVPRPIQVSLSPARADAVVGTGANGKDQIAIFLSAPGWDLTKARAFNLKWQHGSHAHSYRCQNLEVHDHAHHD